MKPIARLSRGHWSYSTRAYRGPLTWRREPHDYENSPQAFHALLPLWDHPAPVIRSNNGYGHPAPTADSIAERPSETVLKNPSAITDSALSAQTASLQVHDDSHRISNRAAPGFDGLSFDPDEYRDPVLTRVGSPSLPILPP